MNEPPSPFDRGAVLHALVENAPALVFAKDLDGRYLYVNDRFLAVFGELATRFVGRLDTEIYPPEVAARLQANDHTVVESGSPLEIDEVVPLGGRQRRYLVVKFPLRSPEGYVFGVGGIAIDTSGHDAPQP